MLEKGVYVIGFFHPGRPPGGRADPRPGERRARARRTSRRRSGPSPRRRKSSRAGGPSAPNPDHAMPKISESAIRRLEKAARSAAARAYAPYSRFPVGRGRPRRLGKDLRRVQRRERLLRPVHLRRADRDLPRRRRGRARDQGGRRLHADAASDAALRRLPAGDPRVRAGRARHRSVCDAKAGLRPGCPRCCRARSAPGTSPSGPRRIRARPPRPLTTGSRARCGPPGRAS